MRSASKPAPARCRSNSTYPIGLPFTGTEGVFEYFLPFTLNYLVLAHLIAVIFYAVFLGMHVAIWAIWQDRAKQKKDVELTSGYGRPLVKQG